MSKEKQNVIYVEPGHWINKNNANDTRYGIYIGNEENSMDYIEFAPDIQDYCVTVDLQVVVPKTTYGVDDGNETYVMRFTSSNNSNSSDISFFSGTKHTFDNVEIVDLSTSPYDCMTYQDVISGADTKELFGINSIDIEYNNYAVPVVTINFTDIRGIGLFSTEEERHDENGTQKDNIVNSFFKCFFKFPYPKFSLMVKGFYGHPVTYELFCADFKANFDSNSGNFNAIAKFVGYSFSLLNDVTMNAIIAAPLSHYHGQQYWTKQVENGNFYFDDKITPIPTFLQFLDNYKKLQSKSDNIGEYKELKDLEDKIKLVNEAINAYDVYYDSLINDFKGKPNFSNDNKNKVFYYDNGFNSSVKTDSLSRDSENCVFTLKKILEKLNVANLLPICTVNREGLRHSDPLTELLKNAPSPYITIIFDGYNLLTFLDNKKNELTHELNNINKKISQKIIDEQIKILGFEPNVKNITYMILAHLDTLLSCIYNCAIEVKNTKRTISDFNFETNKFVDGLKNVNAFPEVHKKTNDGNRNENAWIEDVVYDSSDAPEINLIHGLLNGIDAFETMVQTVKEANPINRSFSKLVTFTDIFSENPFSFLTDTNNISEFVAILSIRMLNVLGTNNISGNTKLINEMGKADAKNFAFVSNVPSDTFFTYIKNGGTLHDFTKFLNIALGKDKNYEFSFGDDGIIFPIEKNGKDYVSRNSIKDEKLTWIKSIPINEIDIEEYDSLTKITYDNNQYNNENYINLLSNVKLSKKDNSNIIKFDLEVDKYINLYTNYENNTELYKRFSIDNSIDTFKQYYDFHNNIIISRGYPKRKDKKYALKNIIVKKTNNNIRLVNDLKENSKWFFKNENGKKLLDIDNVFLLCSYDDLSSNQSIARIDNYNDLVSNDGFSILYFVGYDFEDDGLTINASKCLFTQNEYYEYYNQNNLLGAYLFINTFDIGLNAKDIINDSNMNILPYLLVIKYGAYLWLNTTKIDSKKKLIVKEIEDTIPNFIKNAPLHVKNAFINEFKTWGEHDYIPFIHNNLYVTNIDDFKDEFNECYEKLSKIKYEYDGLVGNNTNNTSTSYGVPAFSFKHVTKVSEFIDVFSKVGDFLRYNVYRTIVKNDDNIILVNNENAKVIQDVSDLLVKKVVLLNTSNLIFGNNTNENLFLTLNENNAKIYYESFIEGLNEIYETQIENINKKSNDTEIACSIDKEIKISMYNYIKILWDRWLSGEANWEKKWSFRKFKERFHFIDSFYQDASKGIINPKNFVKDLTIGWSQTPHSVLTFLATSYERNRFALFNVQNFANFSRTSSVDVKTKMEEMFKPLPYNSIDDSMLKSTPDIIVMYGNEYSSKLHLNDQNYADDSFTFDEDLPQFSSSNEYLIPAFGVTYGKQYQSYFKDISVSMDSPVASEQALRARFEIASAFNSENGENGNHIVPIGADLFTVYSNNSYSCSIKMMGCAWIQPLMYFQLNNIPMFRGAYLIHKVTHHIEPGNMETNITGMRMSRYSTKIIDKAFVAKENTDDGGKNSRTSKDEEYRSANVYNNCDYKFYNPLYSSDGEYISLNELNMTLIEYEKEYNSTFNIDIPANYTKDTLTVLDLLSNVAYGEASNQDELGVKLVLSVIFNRYITKGKNLAKVFFNTVQHETTKVVPTNMKSTYNSYVKDIFLNTPAVLIGKQTYIMKDNNVPICVENKPNGQYSKPINIELEHLQKIDMYCTVSGYDVNDDSDNKKETKPEIWRSTEYILHHDNKNVKGHIFTSENGQRKWDKPNIVPKVSIIDKINSLVSSIKKTINYSSFIENVNIKHKIINENDCIFEVYNENSLSGLSVVFDIILNSEYCNYIENIVLHTSNNTTDLPNKLTIKYKENPKTINISWNQNGNTNINTIDFNELILSSLKKKYETKLSYCRKDFKPFFNQTEENIKKVFDKIKISDCKVELNNGIVTCDGCPWDVINGEGDKNTPKNINGILDVNKMVEHVRTHVKGDNDKGGQCARYVRQAMEAGGLQINGQCPYSACRYKYFLPVWGFEQIKLEGYQPKNGDISVTGARNNHIYGHIQIYVQNENKWYSDKAFVAKNGYDDSDKSIIYEIYRWNGNKGYSKA